VLLRYYGSPALSKPSFAAVDHQAGLFFFELVVISKLFAEITAALCKQEV